MTRVDLHLHLLPGVDDGAPDEATAVAHARRMVAAGVRAATVTPHVGSPFFGGVVLDEIADRTAALQRTLRAEGVALQLHAGGEIHPSAAGDLTAAQLDVIAHGPPGARWVLAEVPFAGIDDAFVDALAAIQGRGFGVVIAHPERAAGVLEGGLQRLRPALEDGAVLQVNACSLLGRQGAEARDAARRFVRARLAYVIASDGHPGHRDHTLADGEAAARAAGASAAQLVQLTQANPRFLLRHGLPRTATPGPRPATPGRVLRAQAAAQRLAP